MRTAVFILTLLGCSGAFADDLASYCRLEKGLEPVSERRCYKPGMGSDALREREIQAKENT